jgi:hypothetical protein
MSAQQVKKSTSSQTHEGRSRLIRRRISLGNPVPRLPLLAFVRGQYMRLDPSALSGRWIALCFPGPLHAEAIQCLNVQAEALALEGAVMLLTLSDARLLRLAGRGVLAKLTAPIMTDPLNRLHRSYGVQPRSPFSQPATFLTDPDRILRLEIHHSLGDEDIEALRCVMRVQSDNHQSANRMLLSQKGDRHVMCAR